MDLPLHDVCCACLPAVALARLAPLRVHAGIRIHLANDRAWLWWTPGDDEVLQRVLALHGANVFVSRGGQWFRPGQHLPAFEVPPDNEARPLAHVLTPEMVQAEFGRPSVVPLTLGLVREDRPRAATALCCSLSALSDWADQATSRQLAALEAIHEGDRVLLRGGRLPSFSTGERFWGRGIWTPLGFRPEPDVSEGVLREALDLQTDDIALLSASGFEVLNARLFQPLTRAGIRLAVRERA
jgi:hypothetical protein